VNPFHFGQPDPESDPESKNQPKSWKISTKINEIIRISYMFFKTIKLMFTDLNIYPKFDRSGELLLNSY